MAERVIPALVPPRLAGPSQGRRRTGLDAPLPVAQLLALPRTGSLVYGMARVDAWGAVSNRVTVEALGWGRGDRLHICVLGTSVLAHRDPTGAFAMSGIPYLVLPAAVRKRNGLRPGDQVLVAADRQHDMLVVHPLSVVDRMLTDYHAGLVGGEHDE